MLSIEDNERLVRVGRRTPAGELFRRYWQPALLSSEVTEPDGAPVRVRLLGEDLIAYRDTGGRVGLVDAFCPHRRAPLFFGRNEENGIRCVYHGWKFSADGKCVDLPSEPASSRMINTITIKAYPTVERGGIVWAYLGPTDEIPQAPDYEWTRAPETHRGVSKTLEHCNYLQGLEGGLDTSHSSFLHNNKLVGSVDLRQRDKAPAITVEPTDYGYTYVSVRKAGADGSYVRVYHYVMPAQQMRGGINGTLGRSEIPKLDGHIWVPVDDENTLVYNWVCGYDEKSALSPEYLEKTDTYFGRGSNDVVPGTFRLKKTAENEYMIDRQKQKTSNFTGITGINTQDFAVQEGMGPIVDRSQEHLGTSDRAIVSMRRLLLEATHAVERGESPRGIDPVASRAVRPHDGLVPPGQDWRQAFAADGVARW
ncbi:MAG: aromatic ring-hydroxylating dioxygenase subunit alpha [Betaproteobacteria bacterium]|nr:aromatic ring-hydroxylating dioxygenase subunit alpha [Betaproteobacteria bacterium]